LQRVLSERNIDRTISQWADYLKDIVESIVFQSGEKEDDDFIFDNVLIDSMSMQYLEGSTIDYEKKAFESNFKIINPNAKASCGCGSSFTI
jgi:iron-sulfur cluster assembly accessory protein